MPERGCGGFGRRSLSASGRRSAPEAGRGAWWRRAAKREGRDEGGGNRAKGKKRGKRARRKARATSVRKEGRGAGRGAEGRRELPRAAAGGTPGLNAGERRKTAGEAAIGAGLRQERARVRRRSHDAMARVEGSPGQAGAQTEDSGGRRRRFFARCRTKMQTCVRLRRVLELGRRGQRRSGENLTFCGQAKSFRQCRPGASFGTSFPCAPCGKRKSPEQRSGLEIWCRGTESNCPHGDFQSPALPTELPRRDERLCIGRLGVWQGENGPFSQFFSIFANFS